MAAETTTTDTPKCDSPDLATEAVDLLTKGKRHLVCNEIPAAVNKLQEACSLLASHYGEMANECGEAYLYYGRALLELARMENGVLGNALDGVPDEGDENLPKSENFENGDSVTGEEREKLQDEVYDAMAVREGEGQVKGKDGEQKPEGDATDGLSESKTYNVEAAMAKDKENNQKVDDKTEPCEQKEEMKGSPPDAPKKDSKDETTKEEVKVTPIDAPKDDSKDDQTKEEMEVTPTDAPKEQNKDNQTKEVTPTDAPKEQSKDNQTKEAMEDSPTDASKDDSKGMEVEASTEKEVAKEGEESSKPDSKEASSELNAEKTEATEEASKANGVDGASEEVMETEEVAEKEGDEEGETSQEEGEEVSQEEDAGEEGEKAEGEEDADDVPNLQLAWEMLELAKVIFSRQESKEMKLRTADCYNYLGEVSLETEQYESAISDFNDCLKLQKEHLEEDNRQIAETHYQLGLSYLFSKQYSQSVESLNSAATCIRAKIANLTKIVEADDSKGKEKASGDNPITAANKEIKELQDILPDILAKIEDAEEEKRNADQLKKMTLDAATAGLGTTIGFGAPAQSSSTEATVTVGFGAPSSSAQKANGAVTNITSMVRKKRKPEEDAAQNGEAKKPKAENGNGTTVANGHSNGVNGTHANGDGPSPQKKEIAVKTVEDVLKSKETPAQSTN